MHIVDICFDSICQTQTGDVKFNVTWISYNILWIKLFFFNFVNDARIHVAVEANITSKLRKHPGIF
jgi:hypothetical protein